MAMRYLIRRTKPEEINDLKKDIKDLDTQLGKPLADLKKSCEVRYSALRSATFQFMTRKTGTEFAWVCPSVELVAENEEGLLALTDKFQVPKPTHLAQANQ